MTHTDSGRHMSSALPPFSTSATSVGTSLKPRSGSCLDNVQAHPIPLTCGDWDVYRKAYIRLARKLGTPSSLGASRAEREEGGLAVTPAIAGSDKAPPIGEPVCTGDPPFAQDHAFMAEFFGLED